MRYKDFIKDKIPLKSTSKVVSFPEEVGETLFLEASNRKYKILVKVINNENNLFIGEVSVVSQPYRDKFLHTFYLSDKYEFYRTENEIQ